MWVASSELANPDKKTSFPLIVNYENGLRVITSKGVAVFEHHAGVNIITHS